MKKLFLFLISVAGFCLPQTAQAQLSKATGTINGHKYVDLGLSVKWATCNIGASTPTDYGDYFAWGEAYTKSIYTDENCRRVFKGETTNIAGNVKYDAASTKWGGTWRLPTDKEFQELIDKCVWVWTTVDGCNGYKVTSKQNNKSIFFPAAGHKSGGALGGGGLIGKYWSSIRYEGLGYNANELDFTKSRHRVCWNNCRFGNSIRPVTK